MYINMSKNPRYGGTSTYRDIYRCSLQLGPRLLLYSFSVCLCVCLSVSARIAYLLYLNHLQGSNHETSLANYYPFTLDNLRQLSNRHLSMQHLSLRHLSISAIYQQYLSCYWFDFDQILNVGSRDLYEHIPTVTMTSVQAIFVLATFVHIRNISAVTDPILTKL